MKNEQDSTRTVADGGPPFVTECKPEESPPQAVVRSIAAIENSAETDIEPLYESVDPDALERLVDHAVEGDRDVGIRFTFEGYTVFVRDTGMIRIGGSPVQSISTDRK